MLSFHHFAQILFLPPLNCLILALLCLLCGLRTKLLVACLISTFFLLLLQYTPIFAGLLTKFIYPTVSNLNHAKSFKPQAIVVLGAGAELNLNQLGEVQAYPAGLTLINLNSAELVAAEYPELPIILSGGHTLSDFSEAQAMRNYLQDYNLLLNPLILENQSLDTDQNAIFTVDKLKEMQLKRIILVTQASHMWRSAALFRKKDIECLEYPAWDEYSTESMSLLTKLTPAKSAVAQTNKLLHEIIGYIVYVIF